jgi:hypothetical protein
VLGTGMRLLDAELGLGDREAIEPTPTRVVHTPNVTHVRYRVNGRTARAGRPRPRHRGLSPSCAPPLRHRNRGNPDVGGGSGCLASVS